MLMEKEIRKLIDLPLETVKNLQKQADEQRQKLKPYMELVLINQANKDKKEKP